MTPFAPKKYHLVFSVVANKEKEEVKKSIAFLIDFREEKLYDIEALFRKYFKILKNSISKENTKALMKIYFEATGKRNITKKERTLKTTMSKKVILNFDYKQDEEYVIKTYKKLLKFSESLSDRTFILVFNILANNKNNSKNVKYELNIRTEYEKSEVF
ncbi:hypothetical protein YS40_116 [Thermus phage phiYS40]|uniref:hypothetical protein n=1 Tax=Thermus phage phiYS40 TaxID=407392 RepID=UPI0000E689EA|nr:hypothetical protein YS40_116 [Thermus phage phiYS40]ABJ91510.1 hypothetical protein YS40_116 [Thermus phage phiYS40]BAK53634.1 hypothetical protein YSP_116 [Thermus phage phiYS40]